MKIEKNKTIIKKLLDRESVNDTSIFVQVIVLVLLVIISISSIFVREFLSSVKALLGVLLVIMAYNNYKIFRRRGFTLVYSSAGIFFMITAILEAYGQ